MARRALLAAAMLGATIGSAQADGPFSGGPRYDGTIKILALTGPTCPPGQVGQVFPATYRLKTKPTAPIGEGISLSISSASGAFYIAAEGDGTFKGVNQSASGIFILDAWHGPLPDMVLNLKFNPSTVDETVTDFTFKGTVQNYTFTGCVATVRGTFTKR
jgi:hypothetical protein